MRVPWRLPRFFTAAVLAVWFAPQVAPGATPLAVPVGSNADSLQHSASAAELRAANELSWAGNSAAATRAYQSLLDHLGTESSSDTLQGWKASVAANAWLGLSNVHAWAGRKVEARAYLARALHFHPGDVDLQRRAAVLDAEATPRVAVEAEHFQDSSDLQISRTLARVDAGEARARTVLATALVERMAKGTEGGMTGGGLRLGARAPVVPGWSAAFELGGTRFASANARAWTELVVSRRGFRGPSLDLGWSYGERANLLKSAAARRASLAGHEFSLGGYRYFGRGRGTWFHMRTGRLSDGNSYKALSSGFESQQTPWMRGVLQIYAIDYARRTSDYYSPNGEWSAGLAVEVLPWRSASRQGSVFVSWGRVGNSWGDGNALVMRTQFRHSLGSHASLGLHLEYAHSVQVSAYDSRVARLELRRGL